MIAPEPARPYTEAYYERVCRHGKSFAVHCKECEIKGYCGCYECVDEDTKASNQDTKP